MTHMVPNVFCSVVVLGDLINYDTSLGFFVCHLCQRNTHLVSCHCCCFADCVNLFLRESSPDFFSCSDLNQLGFQSFYRINLVKLFICHNDPFLKITVVGLGIKIPFRKRMYNPHRRPLPRLLQVRQFAYPSLPILLDFRSFCQPHFLFSSFCTILHHDFNFLSAFRSCQLLSETACNVNFFPGEATSN